MAGCRGGQGGNEMPGLSPDGQALLSHGIHLNEDADLLAREGCRDNREALPTTLSYAAEKCSKRVLRKWRREFHKQNHASAFYKVTQSLPATIKPNRVFTQLHNKPELFGRLTQVRTMHGYN